MNANIWNTLIFTATKIMSYWYDICLILMTPMSIYLLYYLTLFIIWHHLHNAYFKVDVYVFVFCILRNVQNNNDTQNREGSLTLTVDPLKLHIVKYLMEFIILIKFVVPSQCSQHCIKNIWLQQEKMLSLLQ